MDFQQWLDENWQKDNILPPCLEAQKALNFLESYLLGIDWYIVNPLTNGQANCEVVHEILYRYSPKYRKELKQRERELKKRQKERYKTK